MIRIMRIMPNKIIVIILIQGIRIIRVNKIF